MDKRVKELQEELNRYDEAKYGLDEPWPGQEERPEQSAQSGYDASAEWPKDDGFTRRYNDSFVDFLAKHGRERVAKVNAALPRLNPAQQREMMDLAASAKDPVEAVQEYLHKQGFIDSGFKAASIEDVLASKGKQPEADTSAIDERLSALHSA